MAPSRLETSWTRPEYTDTTEAGSHRMNHQETRRTVKTNVKAGTEVNEYPWQVS